MGCSIAGCKSTSKLKRGLCTGHYWRLLNHGDPLAGATTRRGEVQEWITMALECETDECIIWPFTVDPVTGYGKAAYGGSGPESIHVLICIATNGPRPGVRHAAHECGVRLCVNKRHITWKTKAENEADKVIHGHISKGTDRWNAKLTEADVLIIRERWAAGETQTAIAADYGVTQPTISTVVSGKKWTWVK